MRKRTLVAMLGAAAVTGVAVGVLQGVASFPKDACGCSTGKDCTVGDAPAVVGITLQPRTFSGAGCVVKSCGPEVAGQLGSTWPKECPE